MTIDTYTNTDETLTEDPTMYDLLDLFDPATIIEAVNHQGKDTVNSDCWEQRHIVAMNGLYKQIKQIHSEFQTKQADV
jgi:Fe2+ or Zn2+ uptake regulation protein